MKISFKATAKKELSEAQKAYRAFIAGKLKATGKKHPFEGGPDEIADFFAGISEEWATFKKDNDIKTK